MNTESQLTSDEIESYRRLAESKRPGDLSKLEKLLNLNGPTPNQKQQQQNDQIKAYPWIVASIREVALFFDVSHETVKRQWRSTGMPGQADSYDLREIRRWRESRRTAEAIEGGHSSLQEEKLRQDIRGRQLQNDTREGRLVDRDIAQRAIRRMFAFVRERLEAVPDEIAPVLPKKKRPQLVAEVRAKIRLILKSLAASNIDLDE